MLPNFPTSIKHWTVACGAVRASLALANPRHWRAFILKETFKATKIRNAVADQWKMSSDGPQKQTSETPNWKPLTPTIIV